MNIAKKLQTIAENEQKVYEAGKKAATLSGTTSFTDTTKTLTITGLPEVPKQMNIYASNYNNPTTEAQNFIRGLDYVAEGFYSGTSTTKVLAFVWLNMARTDTNTNGAGNGSINEKKATEYNIFSYDEDSGTFTINLQPDNTYYFGENFTYNWTIIF